MGKGTYQATDIKKVDVMALMDKLDQRVVIGLDVAKKDQFAAFMREDRSVSIIVKWAHPVDTPFFEDAMLVLMGGGRKVEVVMEPSGTYGDAIRAGLLQLGVEVFRIAGKRVHDEAEIHDGVASMHDAKAAVIIGRLHLEKKGSQPWPLASDDQRDMEALRTVYGLHRQRELRQQGRIEALLARHWPELTTHLALTTITLLHLLATFGGPAAVHQNPSEARALMKRVGRNFLADTVIDAVLASAPRTLGVPMRPYEADLVRAMAQEALHAHQLALAAERRLLDKVQHLIEPELVKAVGGITAAVLFAGGLAPDKFHSPGAYEKAIGLNLKERSSGRRKGELAITKRGDSLTRKLLFLAAARLIQKDDVVRAWHAAKVKREGGKRKLISLVAIMRKLVKALWHVGRGKPFDSRKLFNFRKLGLSAEKPARGPSTRRAA